MTSLFAVLLFFGVDSTPKHGDTIVFVGDSITQAGDYVADVEAYLLACRPSDFFRVINVGKSSETVSGTSEPDHHPPRPCIHDRFARDVAAFKPNIVVACYGMNDGNYFPFDEGRFEKYKAGMNRFVERVFKETPARALVLLTPPAFDASKAPPPPEDGKSFGYKHPSRDYDSVLRKYSDWLLTLKSDRVDVVDVHRAFARMLRVQREMKSQEAVLSPDAVHPNANGHWLMAQSILEEWTIRPSWKELTLDFANKKGLWGAEWTTASMTPPLSTRKWSVAKGGKVPSFGEVLTRFPTPMLFGQSIKFVGMPKGSFSGQVDGFRFTYDNPGDLERGATLFDRSITPPDRDLNSVVGERRRKISSAWLEAQRGKPFDQLTVSTEVVEKAERDTRLLVQVIDDLRAPRALKVVITSVKTP